MMDIQPIVAFLKRTYPNPEINPAWVRECVQALKDAGSNATVDDVHTQFLYSDLSQSTIASSRVFYEGELHNMRLFPKPTLLQIHYLSEIGYSAFQIQHTMEQRSEVLSGQSLIRRMEDEEYPQGTNDNQEAVEEEGGKVPPYPRSMLKFELSDGRRIVKAMEYKKINGLVLGQTSLGCKLLCQNVRCLRDTLLLTPENTQVIESSVEHLEALQKEQFLNDLKRRMGKLEPGDNENITAVLPRASQRRIQPPPAVRPIPVASSSRTAAPKRSQIQPQSPEIVPTAGPSGSPYFPPVPQQNGLPLFDPPSSPHIIRPIPRRANGVQASSSRKRSIDVIDDNDIPSSENTKQMKPRAAAKAATAQVQQLFHDIPDNKFRGIDYIDEDDGYDYDVDESFIRQIDEVEARASSNTRTTNAKQTKISRHNSQIDPYEIVDDEEDSFMILDESMIRQIDSITNSHHNSTNKGKGKQVDSSTNKSKKKYYDPDEGDEEDGIVLDDEDDFDVDESFLRHLDEMEASRQEYQQKSSRTSARSTTSGRNQQAQNGGSNTRSRPRKKSPSSSLEDSWKENRIPEIIEISD